MIIKSVTGEVYILQRLHKLQFKTQQNALSQSNQSDKARLQVTTSTSIMALALSAVTGLICLTLSSGSKSWPELNPDLEQYQDFTEVSISIY